MSTKMWVVWKRHRSEDLVEESNHAVGPHPDHIPLMLYQMPALDGEV